MNDQVKKDEPPAPSAPAPAPTAPVKPDEKDPSALDKFVDVLDKYKAILGFIGAIILGYIAVIDYFATKKEVAIIQCEQGHQNAVVESRLEIERLTAELAKAEFEALPIQMRVRKAMDAGKVVAEADSTLKTRYEQQITSRKAALEQMTKRGLEASDAIRTKSCQKGEK